MYKIGIIERIHNKGLELLDKNKKFKYEIIEDISKENLIKELPKFDGITLRVAKLGPDILKECKNLKVISRHGVGYDNVDIEYLKNNNIKLLITATANAVSVAEHVMYMILSLSKGITQYDTMVRTGQFRNEANKLLTFELLKKEILIMGFGRIGKILIKRCLGFDMKVNVYDPFVEKKYIEEYGGNKVEDLDLNLKTADYLSIHMPLNEKTKNLINLNKLKTMKKNVIIINTSRGGIINESDLDNAVKNNIIFGAGLDVFEKEPIEPDNPLINNKKILLSPHSATFTQECTARMGIQTVQNLMDFFENKLQTNMIVKYD
tara:strand:- start:2596 stop:3555 length:960 start_codon:yes stop_codon:yes gene_type:complete